MMEVMCVEDSWPLGAAFVASSECEPYGPLHAVSCGRPVPSVERPLGLYPASRSMERGKKI